MLIPSETLNFGLPIFYSTLLLGGYALLGFFIGGLVGGIGRFLPNIWQSHIFRFRHPVGFLAAFPPLWIAFQHLALSGVLLKISQSLIKGLAYFLIFWFLYVASHYLFFGFQKISEKTSSRLDDQLVPILSRIVRTAILVLGFLLILQSFGLQVFSLIAGLGLGGLALALAAKDTAANFFGSLMILLDQPFNIGDWVKIGDAEGTVEDIGLRSTRIRTFYNSVVVVPNSQVAMSTLDNLGERQYRRFRHMIGIEYGTPRKNIENFIVQLNEWVKSNPKSKNPKNEIRLNALSGSSMDVLVYVFFLVDDWSEELIQREELIFKILELSATTQCPIAFPTQTLWLKSQGAAPLDAPSPASQA